LFFVNRFKAESTIAKVLGRTFGIIVSLYLLVLTGSLFMLATSTPGSPLESYTRQVETSDKLTNEMQAVSARVNDLLARLVNTANQIDGLTQIIGQAGSAQTGLTEKTHPTTVGRLHFRDPPDNSEGYQRIRAERSDEALWVHVYMKAR